jgi:F-type H+-transporting ATPase subunit a
MQLLSLVIFKQDVSIFTTNITFILVSSVFILGVYFFSFNITLIPYSWQYSLEFIYNFIKGLLKEQTGERGEVYIPFFSSLFIVILSLNLLSLMPFGIAITSYVVITLFLSFSFIFAFFLTGLVHHEWFFFRIFLPNCPPLSLLLLIPIEIFSYFVRCFSLAIRLSANILAGHTLVVIVAGFILQLAQIRF